MARLYNDGTAFKPRKLSRDLNARIAHLAGIAAHFSKCTMPKVLALDGLTRTAELLDERLKLRRAFTTAQKCAITPEQNGGKNALPSDESEG